MKRMGTPTTWFLAAWAVAAAVGFTLLQMDRLATERSAPSHVIAKFASTAGRVEVRAKETVTWDLTQAGDAVAEGDSVATGRDSSATLRFGHGRRVKLGPDSQIIVSRDMGKGREADATIVTLVRGSLDVVPERRRGHTRPGAKIHRLTVKAETKVVPVSVATGPLHLEMAKPLAPPLPEPVVSGHPALEPLPKAAAVVVATKPVVAPPKPQPAPKPSKPAPPTVSAQGFEPIARDLPAGRVFWSDLPLATPTLTFPLSLTARRLPHAGTWRPVVQASLTGTRAQALYVKGRPGIRTQTLRVPVGRLIAHGFAKAREKPGIISIHLRPAAVVTEHHQSAFSFGRDTVALQLRSFADLPAGPVQLTVLPLVGPPLPRSHWYAASAPRLAGGQTLRLASGRDVARLLPLLRASSSFSVDNDDHRLDSGSHTIFVRNDRVIGTLDNAQANIAFVHRVATLLGSTLVYRGRASAFVSQADAAAPKGGNHPVYVVNSYQGDPFFEVDARLLREVPAARHYLKKSAGALFREEVEVLESGSGQEAH